MTKVLGKDLSQLAKRYPLESFAIGIAAIHIGLVWFVDDTNLLFSSLIFWPAAFLSVGKRPPLGDLSANLPTKVAGIGLIGFAIAKAFTSIGIDLSTVSQVDFLYLYPFLTGLGLFLLMGRAAAWQQAWKPLVLLFFLGVPELILFATTNPAGLTARFADVLLWYVGYDVVREGVWLHLPGGSVEVIQSCSGLRAMTRLLSMAVLSLLCLPRRWPLAQILGLPLLAVAIAFISNGLRVALLAILKAGDYDSAFHSLHGGSTSQLFSIASIALYMAVVWQLVQKPPKPSAVD